MSEAIEFPNLLSHLEYQKMPPEEKETYIKEILRQTLSKNPDGVTITQLKRPYPLLSRAAVQFQQ